MAAIFSSEFLHHRVRARVKPAVEMMASLPSVVLGFLAALVIAPLIEDVVPEVLACFVTIPFALLLAAYARGLWTMRRWVVPISIGYAFYVPTNLVLFWFFDARIEPRPVMFIVVYLFFALGGSIGTREMLHAAKSVRLWQVLGMGIDHFDLDYWRENGMPVAYCPGPASSVALGECAIMFILMLARRYPEARANVGTQTMYAPVGFELEDRTLLLVGFGASARELAYRAKALGMRILGVDIVLPESEELAHYGVDRVGTPAELDEMLGETDFLSMHLPLNNETRHIIDARRLALLPKSAYVINVARGALIDEEALVEALLDNRLAGVGLDVFGQEPLPLDSPLLSMPNAIITPHVAGATDGTARRRAEIAAENCDRVADGLEPLYRLA